MANPEHEAILRQGVKTWNQWRKDNPDIRPDFSFCEIINADFHQANFNLANFRSAQLRKADLCDVLFRNADLSDAFLWQSQLGDADLSDANLRGSNLSESNLMGTDLSGADLSGAELSYAFFYSTNLNRTKFESSIFWHTNLSNVDLRQALGLIHIRHGGPSHIDISTLCRSQGKIPREFLQGAGVPDFFIKQLPSMFKSIGPNQYHSCFISCSAKDTKFTDQLFKALQANGVRRRNFFSVKSFIWPNAGFMVLCSPVAC